jgi:hypothetical protein
MVSALLQLSPGLCEAGEGSSPAGVTAQRRPRGLARSGVRSKFVLDAGRGVFDQSLDAIVFVGHIALHLRGGRARFVNIAPGAPPLQRMRRQRTPRTIVLCSLFCVAACWRGVVALGVRSCFGRAVLFPFGGRVPLDLVCCVTCVELRPLLAAHRLRSGKAETTHTPPSGSAESIFGAPILLNLVVGGVGRP